MILNEQFNHFIQNLKKLASFKDNYFGFLCESGLYVSY